MRNIPENFKAVLLKAFKNNLLFHTGDVGGLTIYIFTPGAPKYLNSPLRLDIWH